MTEQRRAIEKLELWIDRWFPFRAFYEFLGIRWVWEHIWPPTEAEKENDYRPPSSFALWVVSVFSFAFGIYTGLFGIASQRYENTADRIERRANDHSRLAATAQVAQVQKMACPIKPEFLKPLSVLWSFIGKPTGHEPAADLLLKTFESFKLQLGQDSSNDLTTNLAGADLSKLLMKGANLSGSDLSGTTLNGAILQGANLNNTRLPRTELKRANLTAKLRESNLGKANLAGAKLSDADLKWAWLFKTNLKETNLVGVDLSGAFLYYSNLSGADLFNANIHGANLFGADLQNATLA